jgi:hypothetical protein
MFIYVVNDSISFSFFFFRLGMILLSIYTLLSLFIHWEAHWFSILAIEQRNIDVYSNMLILFPLGTYPNSGDAGSYGTSIFSIFSNLHTDFHRDHSNLHSHQHCLRVLFLYIFTSVYYFYHFFKIVFLTEVRRNLNVVLICTSLSAKDVEHLSCNYWPFVLFLLRTVWSVHLSID